MMCTNKLQLMRRKNNSTALSSLFNKNSASGLVTTKYSRKFKMGLIAQQKWLDFIASDLTYLRVQRFTYGTSALHRA